MKQNILIVVTYAVGFILLNGAVLAYAMTNPEILTNMELLIEVSINGNIIFYTAVTIALLIFFRTYLIAQFKDFIKRYKKMLLVSFFGLIGIYAIAFGIGIIFTLLDITQEAENQELIINMLENANTFQFISLLLFIILLAPIVEEIVFRKGIYGIAGLISMKIFKRKEVAYNKAHLYSSIIAIVVSSFFFGAMHAIDIFILLYAGLGVALGAVYYFSNKNVFASILVHIIYNSISIILTLFVLPYVM